MRVAQHARIGSAAGKIFVYEILDHKVAKLLANVQHKMREPMLHRSHPGIIKTIQVATSCFFLRGACTRIIPSLHGDTHHFVTLVMQHQRRDGTIDTAAHRYQHLSFPAHLRIYAALIHLPNSLKTRISPSCTATSIHFLSFSICTTYTTACASRTSFTQLM